MYQPYWRYFQKVAPLYLLLNQICASIIKLKVPHFFIKIILLSDFRNGLCSNFARKRIKPFK